MKEAFRRTASGHVERISIYDYSETSNRKMKYYVYILSNKNNKVLYIGVTNNIIRRIYEHKNKLVEGFTKKYNVHKLVYYEIYENIEEAIKREKELKGWRRSKKEELINSKNKEREDLYEEIIK